MVRVKICGITNLADALASVDAGAHALGFNFYRNSSRYLEPSDARHIIEQLPASVLSVGVFVNEPGPGDIARLANEAKVQAVQLHGDELPSYCRHLKNLFVIKALRVGPEFEAAHAKEYETDAILLDGFTAGSYGGAGKTFDWSAAAQLRPLVSRLFLAGGLNENNVAEAITAVQPYAVDVCSGVESSPGRKDLAKVRAFIAAACEAGS